MTNAFPPLPCRVTRRGFVRTGIGLSAAAWSSRLLPQSSRGVLRILPGSPLSRIPDDFLGLGYEMSSAARPGLLSAANRPYVQLVRSLGPSGVLRLGGIVADFTSYQAEGNAIAEPKNTVVTRASLEQLRGFLDATGWRAIWSVNFGRDSLALAIAEARDVARILGPKLLAIELGNEVENYSRGAHPLRQPPYRFEDFLAEYIRWRRAMLAAVPGLRFAAPDTAASVEWVERMAAQAHGEVQLLTTHYYRGDQKLGTEDQLTHPDAALQDKLSRLHKASSESGIPWRMCETNSFFGGGRPGVSDTMAGTLWTLDYLLLLAQNGCSGVNLETGVNQLGFISSYSPIQDDGQGQNTAGAPYYGMLAFALATEDARSVVACSLTGCDPAVTAYALGEGARLRRVVIINKSAGAAVISLVPLPLRDPHLLRLAAPALSSRTGITLGGRSVAGDGHYSDLRWERAADSTITVPAASAVIVRSA